MPPRLTIEAVYTVIKERNSSTISFVGEKDSVHFESINEKKKLDQPPKVAKITTHRERYNVTSFFSGLGYYVNSNENDTLIATYGDMPYGELIVNGVTRIDTSGVTSAGTLNFTVTINGVRGIPSLELNEKKIGRQKSKKEPISEIQITSDQGDKIYCSASRTLALTGMPAYTLKFNEVNSHQLNERLKVLTLFILWLYEKES
jgi:hypothetical protein